MSTTLEEARSYLRKNWEKGVKCPCCGQFVKLYKRKLNSSMAYGLILIAKRLNGVDTDEWFHLENYFKSLPGIPPAIRSDLPALRHWGLLEQKEGERIDSNKNVGYYRLTEKGKDFVQDTIFVPARVHLFNQHLLGFDEKQINIKEALSSKFSYSELMKS